MTPEELWALGHKPSLNDVDVSFLDTLPGIGKSLAHTLVRTREDMGGFKTWEEVDNIPGIGPHTLQNIQARMTLQPPL
jgi:competence protein ComEA